jgi:mRNA interferase RelE/StbE
MTNFGRQSYNIEYLDSVDSGYLRKIGRADLTRIKTAIEQKLATRPYHFGKPLKHSWRGHHSLRVGEYRVIYRIHEDDGAVIIAAIGHRKDIYSGYK